MFKSKVVVRQMSTHLVDLRRNHADQPFFEVFGLGNDGMPYKWNWVIGEWEYWKKPVEELMEKDS